MTMPIIVGFGMTIAYWTVYRLKPRRWRKWGGLLVVILGTCALFGTESVSAEWSLAFAITAYIGLWLFEARDLFSEDEG